jgi:hypothetical protein
VSTIKSTISFQELSQHYAKLVLRLDVTRAKKSIERYWVLRSVTDGYLCEILEADLCYKRPFSRKSYLNFITAVEM